MKPSVELLLLSAAALASSAFAQESSSHDPHELETVVIAASPFASHKEELVTPASKLSGEALNRASQASLGATLDGEPGVHSTYFGPGSGRPVIRGFDGDRVRILNQGTDSFDVSQTSPDHGVSIEPLFARDIEVIRGPASLLYGNAAIGGVVNVIGKELPRERAPAPLLGQLEAAYGSVSDSLGAGLTLEGGANNTAWSAGYLERGASDHEIPGLSESAHQFQAEGEPYPAQPAAEEGYGALENSFSDTRSGYFGATRFFEKGSIGFSYSEYDTDYGVPGHAHAEEEELNEKAGADEEGVAVDLDQSRFSLRAELLEPNLLFESLELQFANGDYRHRELEGDAIGSVFEREGSELRATGTHSPIGALTGAIGLHIKDDAFSALGDEAFIPSNQSSSLGLFLVERLNTEWGAWEFGGRLDAIEVDPETQGLSQRSFTTATGSVGLVATLDQASALSANVAYAERAPNASELYAFGPHTGTQSFEIGNASLDTERSLNLDLGIRRSAGRITGELTAFYANFDDYVYLQSIDLQAAIAQYGDIETHDLRVLQAAHADARFYGFELELRFHLIDQGEDQFHFDLLLDQTRAWNKSAAENLPRIPTRRIGGRLERATGPWLFGVEGRYSDSARRLAPHELPTDAYVLWNADVRYRLPTTGSTTIELHLVGRNLDNTEARPHTSFLKDLAPLSGRSIEVGTRIGF